MFHHCAEPCFISGAWLVRPVQSAGLSGQDVRIVSDKEMSILADGAEIAGERISEFVAIHNGLIIAVLLMVMNGLNHLRRDIRIHVILSYSFTDGVNRLLPA